MTSHPNVDEKKLVGKKIEFDSNSIERLNDALHTMIEQSDVKSILELDQYIRQFDFRALSTDQLKANHSLLLQFAQNIRRAESIVELERQKVSAELSDAKHNRSKVKHNITKMNQYHKVRGFD
ncbi:hypothetical protein [Marinomonas mediterranea]|uniref:Uncharacterized protein n=1 Tax=Marinomonas mediterranea (strain ATCC 700492 / JCM 21426 / NBRC 103028 / MMB-1) TaxID=717774 RepID=F2K0H5_MARM1|nr:hypothetical protein [Marinomonas mediterranea]ADZ90959.1 hypothetical protein Marme_1702 [Marinomonas mediterranea MMB-1]WCN08995.1 hypothetical protein GV055_08705 [Marinomonas mediterranea]WCN13029.1 hypothetical protein GV054_08435 [Marinomonas mediterranea]WCN17102.1 hypothetical protein GV053_08615 [Marinomonas mediterranea MMB-1]